MPALDPVDGLLVGLDRVAGAEAGAHPALGAHLVDAEIRRPVGLERHVGGHRAEAERGAQLGRDQRSVLAELAEAGQPGKRGQRDIALVGLHRGGIAESGDLVREPHTDIVERVVDPVHLLLRAWADIGHVVVRHGDPEHDDRRLLRLAGLGEGKATVVFGDADCIRPHLAHHVADLVGGLGRVADLAALGIDRRLAGRQQDLVADIEAPLGRWREAGAEPGRPVLVGAADATARGPFGLIDIDGAHARLRPQGGGRAPSPGASSAASRARTRCARAPSSDCPT